VSFDTQTVVIGATNNNRQCKCMHDVMRYQMRPLAEPRRVWRVLPHYLKMGLVICPK